MFGNGLVWVAAEKGVIQQWERRLGPHVTMMWKPLVAFEQGEG